MPRSTKLQQGKTGKLASKRSKTSDPACSSAVSKWKTSGMTPDVASTLARCRAMAANRKKATLQREAGNEGKAQVLEKRAERGMTGKDRLAKAKDLVAARKAKIDARVQAKAELAKPSLREQADAARAAKGDRASRIESLRMKAYDAKRQHSNAALSAGRNQSQYLQKASRARTASSKADWQGLAGTQARIADREFNKVGRVQRWTDKLDAAQKPQRPVVDRRAEVIARLEQRRAAIQAPEGQAKIAAQRQRAMERDATNRPLFGAKAAPAKPDRLARLGATDPKVKAMLAERRTAKAAELRQQRAAKPAASPLTQAAAARAAKGDRSTRLKALAERSMTLAERRATKAGSLSGAAQDRMIGHSMAAAEWYNKLEAARTPYSPATAVKAVPAAPSLLEQARKAREAKGPAGSRAGMLANRAKKKADAARKDAEKAMAKAMTAMSTGGTDFALKAARKATTVATVNSDRFQRLAARFAGMKTVNARVVK